MKKLLLTFVFALTFTNYRPVYKNVEFDKYDLTDMIYNSSEPIVKNLKYVSLNKENYLNNYTSNSNLLDKNDNEFAAEDFYFDNWRFETENENKKLDVSFKNQGNFCRNYFLNLTNEMLVNEDGICGYTACGMYLSYLDTVWNNNLIPEKYETGNVVTFKHLSDESIHNYRSPGLKDETIRKKDFTFYLEQEEIKSKYVKDTSKNKNVNDLTDNDYTDEYKKCT